MSLVCKKCGYKQTDSETIVSAKKKFPGMEEHDIPYYCGACMDTANEEEYNNMMNETKGNENAPVILIQTYRGLVDSVFSNIDLPAPQIGHFQSSGKFSNLIDSFESS